MTNIAHCAGVFCPCWRFLVRVGGFLLVVAVSQNRRVNISHKPAKLGFEKPVARCEHRLARLCVSQNRRARDSQKQPDPTIHGIFY